jgi:hypothetical protein
VRGTHTQHLFHEGNMANSNQVNPMDDQEVEVLYQKLGDRWFAYTIVNEDVFMAPISDEEITNMRTTRASSPLPEASNP